MLIAVGCAVIAAVCVWLTIPSPKLTRLRAVHGQGTEESGLIDGLIRRRQRFPSAQEKLAVALRTLSAELRAGCAPTEALRRAGGTPPLWPRALAAAHFGEPVDAGLLEDARTNLEISQQLRQLAACWSVGVVRGSSLAVSVERLALSIRAQQELRATLRSELSAPRATSRMLALLPVIGILMSYLLGANPIAWFLGSAAGLAVFATAVVLTVVGSVWTRRIVNQVERGLA